MSGGSTNAAEQNQMNVAPPQFDAGLLMGAQLELLKAQARKTDAEADNISEGGIDYKLKEGDLRLLAEQTTNEELKGDLLQIEGALKSVELATNEETFKENIWKIKAAARAIILDNDLKDFELGGKLINKDAIYKSIGEEALSASIKNSLMRSQNQNVQQDTKVLEERVKEIKQHIVLMLEEARKTSTENYYKPLEMDLKKKLTEMSLENKTIDQILDASVS